MIGDVVCSAKLRNSGGERRRVYRIECECRKNYTESHREKFITKTEGTQICC